MPTRCQEEYIALIVKGITDRGAEEYLRDIISPSSDFLKALRKYSLTPRLPYPIYEVVVRYCDLHQRTLKLRGPSPEENYGG